MKMLLLLWTICFATTAVLAQVDIPNCADFPDGAFVDNPSECRAYWYCANALADPAPRTCPDGQNFNPDIGNCEEGFPCDDPEIDTTLPPPTTTEEPETTEEATTTTPRPPPPRNVCEGLPDGRLVNNPTGCRSYFVCQSEIPLPRQCDMGLNFNEELQICDHPSFTPCSNDNFECPFFGVSRWEVPGSCVEYNFCFSGQHRVQQCGLGLLFDSSISLCALEENVDCERDLCPIDNDIDDIVYHPSENDCNQYYICYSGSRQLQLCAPGLHWDQESRSCQRPEYADCELTPPTTEPPTEEPTTLPPVAIECPDVPGIVNLPHPYICQNYFICSNGVPYEQRCLDGLLFDALLFNCNIAAEATCAPGATRNKRISRIKSFFLKHTARHDKKG